MLLSWLKSKKIIILFCFVIFACKQDDKQLLAFQKIQEALNVNFSEGYVLVISDLDCESCKNYLTMRITDLQTIDKPIHFYYYQHNRFESQYLKSIKQTFAHLKWKNLVSKEFFALISQYSDKHGSPFLILINRNKITVIQSVTKS